MKKITIHHLTTTLAFLFIAAISAFAQDTEALMKTANTLFEEKQYKQALPIYEQVIAKDNQYASAYLKLGICHLFTFRPQIGLDNIKKAGEMDKESEKSGIYFFWLARAYHLNMQFSDAIQTYRKANSLYTDKEKPFKNETIKYIEQLHRNRIQFLEQKPVTLERLPIGINSIYSEHTPILSKDGNFLLFTSRRPISAEEPIAEDGQYYEKVFISEKDKEGIWQEPRPLNLDFGIEPKDHFACVQLFDNDSKLLLFKSSPQKGVHFYVSTKENGKWAKPEEMKANFGGHKFHSDVYFNEGMTKIFFVDYKENAQNLDVFYVEKKSDGKWSKALPLSDKINSNEDERSPVLINDSTLIFCSKGHNTFGGYDIFKSYYDKKANTWSEPFNLGLPINSAYDDIYFYPNDSENAVYIASERPYSVGEVDMYKVIPIVQVVVKGLITARDATPVDDIMLYFYQNNQKAKEAKSNEKGEYAVELISGEKYDIILLDGDNVVAEEKDFQVKWVNVLDKEFTTQVKNVSFKQGNTSTQKETNTQVKNITVDVVRKKDALVSDMTSAAKNDLQATASNSVENKKAELLDSEYKLIAQVFFDYAKFEVKSNFFKQLNAIVAEVKNNDAVFILLEGYADSIGNPDRNLILSEKRATAIFDYFKSKGIEDSKIKLVGKGQEPFVGSKSRRVDVKVAYTKK
jgi:outer membrane protein OmpA-like peptidoglycan-associated protein/tetratricopeptide (TPR) repeat protein